MVFRPVSQSRWAEFSHLLVISCIVFTTNFVKNPEEEDTQEVPTMTPNVEPAVGDKRPREDSPDETRKPPQGPFTSSGAPKLTGVQEVPMSGTHFRVLR